MGDVSWLTPTAQIHVAAWPNGCPGHSWQNVSCDRTEIGHKAAVHAGKDVYKRQLLNTLKALTLTVNLTLEHFGYEPVDEDHVRQFVGDGYKLLMERVLRYRGDEQLEHYEESLKVYLELFAVHSMDGVHPLSLIHI